MNFYISYDAYNISVLYFVLFNTRYVIKCKLYRSVIKKKHFYVRQQRNIEMHAKS